MIRTKDEAVAEVNRWFDYLDKQRDDAQKLVEIARKRRQGLISETEGRRELNRVKGPGVSVYDGSRLRDAVIVLLKELGEKVPSSRGGKPLPGTERENK